MESNDSPEIPDREETSSSPASLRGFMYSIGGIKKDYKKKSVKVDDDDDDAQDEWTLI